MASQAVYKFASVVFVVSLALYGLLIALGFLQSASESGTPPGIDLNYEKKIEQLVRSGKVDEAMLLIEKDLEVNFADINKSERLVTWGDRFGMAKYPENSITCYRRALDFDAESLGAHFGLGVQLGRKGDWKGAIEHLEKVVRRNPTNDQAQNALQKARYEAAR